MKLDIPLELYRIFCTVIRTGNMSLAAKELFISQPAVSMAIKQLEERFGNPLLVRSSKGIRPTSEGQVLYEYLNQGLNLIRTGEKKYLEMAGLLTGEVRIGASDTLLSNYLLPFLEQYIEEYDKINIKITNRTTYETIALLKKGQVDIGFVNLPVKYDEQLEIYECLEIQDCLIAGVKFKYLAERGIDIADLNDYPLLLLENDSNSRRYIDYYAQKNGVLLKPNIELGSFDLLMKFAKRNIGVVFGIREFSKDDIDNETLFEIPLSPQIPKRSIGMIKLKGVALSHAASKFAEFLRIG